MTPEQRAAFRREIEARRNAPPMSRCQTIGDDFLERLLDAADDLALARAENERLRERCREIDSEVLVAPPYLEITEGDLCVAATLRLAGADDRPGLAQAVARIRVFYESRAYRAGAEAALAAVEAVDDGSDSGDEHVLPIARKAREKLGLV